MPRLAVLSALCTVTLLVGVDASRAEKCPSGAEVDDASMCAFFEVYKDGQAATDKRILNELGEDDGRQVRSIALIIANDDYSELGDSLPPVIVDRQRLVDFLKNDQEFDEIILLNNKDASKENIDYFLQRYLPQHSVNYSKVRALIAYTGHGVPKSLTNEASLLLAGAKDITDPKYLYDLPTLRNRLLQLAQLDFHLLVLVNACYGGNIFAIPGLPGGNWDVTNKRGAYILTAGPNGVPVASLGGPKDGSIFFDNIINGIRSGDADLDYNRLIARDGALYQYGGLVRLGPLNTYVTTEARLLTDKHIPTPDGPLVVEAPWSGPISPAVEYSGGGFFFLAPIRVANADTPPIEVPPGPISSIPGRPDIKVFKPQQEYSIRGIDVSQHEGDIIWPQVVEAKYRFAYIRASSFGRKDNRFDEHWRKTRQIGLLRGAYHAYSYCGSIGDQLELIERTVPVEDDALPFAIDVEAPYSDAEKNCKARWDQKALSDRLVALSEAVSEHFHKRAIVYGNRSTLQEYFGGADGVEYDRRLDQFMIWLAVWRGDGSDTSGIRLPGSNPWTLWQYTGHATIAGIGDNVDVNVFFGTEQQFDDFRKGGGNAALTAANLTPQ